MNAVRPIAAEFWPLLDAACDGCLSDADRLALRLDRQALHASRLAFRHPRTDRPVEFVSPIPADMRALAETLAAGSRRSETAATEPGFAGTSNIREMP